MRIKQSGYMHFAKFKAPVRFALTGSEVPHFRMDSLPIDLADLEMDGASHPRYVPIRERIARHAGVDVEQVVSADGTSMANFLAMATLICPGDKVLIEHPTYELLVEAASFLGAIVRRFRREAEDGYRVDPRKIREELCTDTRLIVLTNLHNPSGVFASEADLREVHALATEVGAHVLVDEVYLDAVAPRRESAVHLGPRFVTTNSLTKVYGLSGLRCGWILAKTELAERMWRLNDLFGVNQAHQAERLACVAFDHLNQVVGDKPAMLRQNRELFNHFLLQRPDLACAPAIHGITAFPRWTGNDTQLLDDHLRTYYDTAVVPGRWFNMPEHFRVGFGLATNEFELALARLAAGLDDLR